MGRGWSPTIKNNSTTIVSVLATPNSIKKDPHQLNVISYKYDFISVQGQNYKTNNTKLEQVTQKGKSSGEK